VNNTFLNHGFWGLLKMNEREKGLHPQDPHQVVTYFLFTTWMSVGWVARASLGRTT
jgi:hypothetical protein